MQQLLSPCSTACARTWALLLRHRVRSGWPKAAPIASHRHCHHRQPHGQGTAVRPAPAAPLAAATDRAALPIKGPATPTYRAGSSTTSSSSSRLLSSVGTSTSTHTGSALGSSPRALSSASSGFGGSRGGRHGQYQSMRRSVALRAAGGGGPQAGTESGNGYWTLQGYVLYESEVKKSKFVVHAWPVSSPREALALIRAASDPAASHNCFAYRLGDECRSSDDGEPGGTAGRPIAGAIEGEGLDRVAVLVTRYFGGIKLGAGGLVRAYGGAAKECLRLAPRVFAKAQSEVVVEVTYDELGTVYGCLDMHGAARLAEEYGSSGTVTIRARVDADRLESLRTAVADGTGGRRRVELVEAAAAAASAAGSD